MGVPVEHVESGGRGQRRDLIVAAAVEEFARHGYEAASTNRIARRAGVAKGLVFRHFGSKEGLFDAALEQARSLVLVLGQESLPPDPLARLEEFVLRRLTRLASYPVHARLIAQCRARLTSALGAPARKIEKSYAPMRQAFRDGADTRRFRPGVDPDTALELLLLVAEGIEGQALDRLRVSAGDLQQESQAGSAAVASDLDGAGASDLRGAGASDLGRAGAPDLDGAKATDLDRAGAVDLDRAGAMDLDRAGATDLGAARRQVQLFRRLLAQGLYRPGVRVSAPPVPVDFDAFLELPARLARPAPAAEAGDQRRDRILQAAQALFAERGYDGTSAEAVAAGAGVAKGLVFHHFGSKAELYVAAVADAIAKISSAFVEEDGPSAESDLLQRLFVWTQRKMRIFQKEPTLYRLVLGAFTAPPAEAREALNRYLVHGTQQGWSVIVDGVDTTPFRPGVDLSQAVELVMLVLNTYTDRLLPALATQTPPQLETLPAIAARVGDYLDLLREGLV